MKLLLEKEAVLKTVKVSANLLLALFSTIASAFLSAEDNADEDGARTQSAGGSLNYRTGERDDGRDPYGWYDHK
jgi:hypothetical protein